MIAITAGVLASRVLFDLRLKKINRKDAGDAKSDQSPLSPAELACIARPNDLFHVVFVMAVDLVQRALKSTLKGEGAPPILDYEMKMWELTRDFVRQSAEKKIEPYLPDKFSTNPIGYFKRLSYLHASVVRMVRKVSTNVIKDPKHLRKYFSITGLVRLSADFFTAGYQDAVEAELTTHLVEKQLLVSGARCAQYSKVFISLGLLFTVVSIFTATMFLPGNLVLWVPLLAVLTAVLVHLTIFLRDLIPLYPEFNELLGHLKRTDWRLTIIRVVLFAIRILSSVIILSVFVAGVALSFILLVFVVPGFPWDYISVLTTLAFVLIACFSLITYGMSLRFAQVPTLLGHSRLSAARNRISKVSPIATFWEMLRSDSYEPQFSEIVAVYGIAPVIILA